MKLYIVRHGETDWNKEGMFQGQSNIPLNKIGIEQASILSEKLKDLKIDYIYSSPLDRAIKTAESINKYHHSKMIIDESISERALGTLEGKKYEDYDLYDLWEHILNLQNRNDNLYNVETLQHMLDRAFDFLNKICLTYQNQDINILLVSHGSFILALLLTLGSVDKSVPLYEHHLENCCCYSFENPTIYKI